MTITWDYKFNNQGNLNLYWENGTIANTQDRLPILIYFLIFAEKRATNAQMQDAMMQRGHYTNEFYVNYEVGSLFWFYTERQINNDNNLNLLKSTIQEALSILETEKLARDIIVRTIRERQKVLITVELFDIAQNKTRRFNFFV